MSIIFGRNVTEKEGNQKMHYFPTPSSLCFCTTWGKRKPRNCIYLFKNCMWCCQQTHKNIISHSWTILRCQNDWLCAPDRTQEGSKAFWCMLSPCLTFSKSVTVTVLVWNTGDVLRQGWNESQWTVLLRYLINILLSQGMLDAIKCVVDDNIVPAIRYCIIASEHSPTVAVRNCQRFSPATVQDLTPLTTSDLQVTWQCSNTAFERKCAIFESRHFSR